MRRKSFIPVSFLPSLFAVDLSTSLVLVDDGTAVLECTHLPVPLLTKETVPSKDQSPKKLELPTMLTPITQIGQFIRVEGRVHRTRESRQIVVQNISGLFFS